MGLAIFSDELGGRQEDSTASLGLIYDAIFNDELGGQNSTVS